MSRHDAPQTSPVTLTTPRLILRQWREADRAPFAALGADPEVMRYFPALLSQEESDEAAQHLAQRIADNGWGFWAVEHRDSGAFLGFVGLNAPQVALPFTPCVEVGWRLGREHWGNGYATEAARAALDFGFTHLNLTSIVAFTAHTNAPSEAVMRRLGMTRDSGGDFLHPAVPADHPLQPFVLYRITREAWLKQRAQA